MRTLSRWALSLCLPLGLWAAEPPAPEEESPTLLEQMTVVAERTPTTLSDTAGSVSVIDQRQIEREVMVDSSDLVRYEPGVTVALDPERLGLNGFRIRGVGANRVHTQIDGVRTAESFAFGPLAIHQYQIDVDFLQSVEVVKSAGSSLYGSDALGGVVALQTIGPDDLIGSSQTFGGRLKTGYDSTTEGRSLSAATAWRQARWSFMAAATLRDHEARDNQGTVNSSNRTRTLPNDSDGNARQMLLKGVFQANEKARWEWAAEVYNSDTDTRVFSGEGVTEQFGALVTISDFEAQDEQQRLRLSMNHQRELGAALADTLQWRLYLTRDETTQDTVETRNTRRGPMVTNIRRNGSFDLEQRGYGLDLMFTKSHGGDWTYGLTANQTRFEQVRDRTEFDLDSGNPDAYQGTLVFPSRYFPISDVHELGAYVQWHGRFWSDRLALTPGLRYDHYRIDPKQDDAIYLAGTDNSSTPETLDDGALTPKLGVTFDLNSWLSANALYAEGFRAPPHSSVNSGFTNLAGGYQTLPNADLDAESSRNLELGLRALWHNFSARVTRFENRYDDFIQDTAFVGFSQTGIMLFQPQNLDNVSIEGWEAALDTRIGSAWRLRAAYTDLDSEDRATGAPLASIDPSQAVLGVNYRAAAHGIQAGLSLTHTAEKSGLVADDSNPNPFIPEAVTTVDATFAWSFQSGWRLNLGLFNIGDEHYWQWQVVRGRNADDATLDRYSEPGRNARVQLHYRW